MGNAVFEGIRVLDFSNNVAGPCCASLLADMGAEVIKIERPVAGDDSRGIMPRVEGQSLTFIWTNRGKKSVELDLHDPEAVELIKRMIMDADIIVESFKPGQMKKFGLDYETVHAMKPSLVYCSISACGQTGAYASKPGFDIIAQGMSGLMDLAGDPDGAPVKQGVTIGDYVGSLNAYGAIVTALYHSRATGKGQLVDISLLDGLVYCNTTLDNAATNGAHPTRSGPHHGTMAPYGVYNGKNGQSVIIAAFTAAMWKRLCAAMGRSELETDERFNSNAARTKNLKELSVQHAVLLHVYGAHPAGVRGGRGESRGGGPHHWLCLLCGVRPALRLSGGLPPWRLAPIGYQMKWGWLCAAVMVPIYLFIAYPLCNMMFPFAG